MAEGQNRMIRQAPPGPTCPQCGNPLRRNITDTLRMWVCDACNRAFHLHDPRVKEVR